MSTHLPNPAVVMRDLFAKLASGGRRELGFDNKGEKDWKSWQTRLRAALAERMVLQSEPSHEVVAEFVGSEQGAGFRRHLIRIRGRDGAVIPAYWLVPDGLRAPAATVLALHGHGPGKATAAGASQDAQRNELEIIGERDYAARAAQQGYLALAPDLRGFGEMTLPDALLTKRPSTCVEMSMRAIAAGQSLVGMRVRDIMSCVDWVAAQADVDSQKIVVTGQSGGGTYSIWAAAMDTRIAGAVPACALCTFEHAMMSVYHCPCNYLPGVLDLCEFHDVAGLIAPRPLLAVTGALDPIFPLEGVRLAFDKLQAIYKAADAEDNLDLFVGPEGHRYYAEPLWPFLAKRI
ncbi:MAG: prolyl oligopeptidase family serine peptidase [Deltaproteobacteria bacterium]|nr:prolyl oligopeptidase family serine peptidase [Deltaproteobacteria bacterium]